MKSLALAALLAFTALTAMTAQAQSTTKGDLACRLEAGEIPGTARHAKQASELPDTRDKGKKTSIGTLTWDRTSKGELPYIVPFINGKPVVIRKENQGNFGYGKIYDLGGKILLAYKVERFEDSRASPSEFTLLLGPGGVVIEEYLINGEEVWDHTCIL